MCWTRPSHQNKPCGADGASTANPASSWRFVVGGVSQLERQRTPNNSHLQYSPDSRTLESDGTRYARAPHKQQKLSKNQPRQAQTRRGHGERRANPNGSSRERLQSSDGGAKLPWKKIAVGQPPAGGAPAGTWK